MEPNYLIILNYVTSQLIKIKLTDEEKQISEKFDDFEDFMETELEKYGFRTKDVHWLVAEDLEEISYNI